MGLRIHAGALTDVDPDAKQVCTGTGLYADTDGKGSESVSRLGLGSSWVASCFCGHKPTILHSHREMQFLHAEVSRASTWRETDTETGTGSSELGSIALTPRGSRLLHFLYIQQKHHLYNMSGDMKCVCELQWTSWVSWLSVIYTQLCVIAFSYSCHKTAADGLWAECLSRQLHRVL